MQAKIDSVMHVLSRQNGPEAIIIANGFKADTIQRIIRGEVIGTIFRKQQPQYQFLSANAVASEVKS